MGRSRLVGSWLMFNSLTPCGLKEYRIIKMLNYKVCNIGSMKKKISHNILWKVSVLLNLIVKITSMINVLRPLQYRESAFNCWSQSVHCNLASLEERFGVYPWSGSILTNFVPCRSMSLIYLYYINYTRLEVFWESVDAV